VSDPIEDGPTPAQASQASADASFVPGPPVAQLCGFKLPSFVPKFSFSLPGGLSFPPKLPTFPVQIGLNCNASNPLNVSAGLSWGGGRVSSGDPDADDLLDQETSNGQS
jgi:hypothetical protein